jgi:uncharacterized protein with von Willebrand factor type A (vWA) domain
MPLVHTYLGYDPIRFGSPNEAPPDLVSGAMNHLLAYGRPRRFTPEELANAIRIDPSQITSLGPSIDALIALLEARRDKILATYETTSVRREAEEKLAAHGDMTPPPEVAASLPPRLLRDLRPALDEQNIPVLERIWGRLDERSDYAVRLLRFLQDAALRYEADALAATWTFTGRSPIPLDQAPVLREELETIERLLKQLREARKNAKPAIVDLDALSRFVEDADVESLRGLQRQVNELLERLARDQGLESTPEGLALTPKAMRIYQSRLLEKIFGDLAASRSGRHQGRVVGDGAVELPSTRGWEFGDSPAHLDLPQTIVNALLRSARDGAPLRLHGDDMEVHRTRNTPKCATAVLLDMSGSMRYGGQYVAVKKMALALDGLIRREYPGDHVEFVEMYTLAKRRSAADLAELMPKQVSIHDPVVRLRADLDDPTITEMDLPLHFTNIQRALQLARQLLAARDTPNKQIMLLTDGLPTAHFEGARLFMLYPPDPRTEDATMREAQACRRDGITLNIVLLPSWSQSEEDVRFAHRMAEATGGRVLFTGGADLDRFVVWDYVARRRSIIG